MGTFDFLHNLMRERDLEDTRTATHVAVTPEDIEAAVQTQQPISPVQVETMDTSGTYSSSHTPPQTFWVPQVPTPKVSNQKEPPSPPKNSDSQELEPEPELE